MKLLLSVFVTLLLALLTKDAVAKTDLERGAALVRSRGCTACHSIDGTSRVGPSFLGVWGSSHPVALRAGGTEQVVVDEAYLARSLRDPDAQITLGFPSGNMPEWASASDEDVRAIAAVLASHKTEPSGDSTRRGGSIVPLALCAAAFAFLHFLLSAVPVRQKIIQAVQLKGFSAIYSLVALGAFAGMIWFYRSAPYIEVWSPPRVTRWVPVLLMPIAILFMVCGFSTRSPTSVGQGAMAKEDKPPRGILAVTRHPALWGFALWGFGHLATNGELHVVLVATSIVVLAIGGMMHIDARRKKELGEGWTPFAQKTSLVPFAAMISGRAKLRLSEVGVVRVLITAFLYTAILHTHALIVGASPFP